MKEISYKVVEIFNSIEGEGRRAGLPCTFIRLWGCNLRCSYCDSMYAVEGTGYTEMTLDEILSQVSEFECPSVTVTGGEPLIHKDINKLLYSLLDSGYDVNVETNGSIKPPFHLPKLFYTVDFKTWSSGESDKMNRDIFPFLMCRDVIKFVVGTEDDLKQVKQFVETVTTRAQIYISPIFGQIEPVQIVDYIKKNKLWNCKVQLQLHKFIWDPNKKGV